MEMKKRGGGFKVFSAAALASALFIACVSTGGPSEANSPAASGNQTSLLPEKLVQRHIDDMALQRVLDAKTGMAFAQGVGWDVASSDDMKTYIVSKPYVAANVKGKVVSHFSFVPLFDTDKDKDNSVGGLNLGWPDILSGYSLAMSPEGTVAGIGAPGREKGSGAIYIFAKSDQGWIADKDGDIQTALGGAPY
ncbi:MAG: hypothetical protein ABSF43_13635 [Rectinemataceae bacterium]|jgi:hypothetical protein